VTGGPSACRSCRRLSPRPGAGRGDQLPGLPAAEASRVAALPARVPSVVVAVEGRAPPGGAAAAVARPLRPLSRAAATGRGTGAAGVLAVRFARAWLRPPPPAISSSGIPTSTSSRRSAGLSARPLEPGPGTPGRGRVARGRGGAHRPDRPRRSLPAAGEAGLRPSRGGAPLRRPRGAPEGSHARVAAAGTGEAGRTRGAPRTPLLSWVAGWRPLRTDSAVQTREVLIPSAKAAPLAPAALA
jgi:hypothetical protein